MDIFDSTLLIPFIVSMVVIVVVIGLFTQSQNKHSIEKRIKKIAQDTAAGGHDEAYKNFDDYGDTQSGMATLMERTLSSLRVDPAKEEQAIAMRFAQAGIRNPNAAIYYVFMKKLGLPIAMVIAILLMLGESKGFLQVAIIIIALVVIFMGYKGADLYLKNRKDKRQFILQRSFPDGLDLILVCVEAGLALDAALSRVCREMEFAHPELTYELNKTRMELTMLNDRSKALQNLAERTDLVSFRALCSALLQSEKFGTSLTDTLRVLSDDYRATRMLAAENKANKLPALITVPLMLLMMPSFIMILLGPAFIMLAEVWGKKK